MTTNEMATLQQQLGLRYPIVSAPMAYVAGGDLAGAVSKAGGFGLIGGGYGDLERKELGTEWIDQQFALAHAHFPSFDPAGDTRSPVGIGFITWALDSNPKLLTHALTHKPRAVFLSFGDHTHYADEIHAAGAVLICQVQTVKQAEEAVRTGADIIVAQGSEAGGHGRPGRGSISLVPAIVDAVAGRVPVLAAGGIADGRGIAAALSLGASGVLIGTRFLVSQESVANLKTKKHVMASTGEDTFRTRLWDVLRKLPWPAGYDARTTKNPFSEKWDSRQSELTEKEIAEWQKARDEYDFTAYTAWCGESVDLINETEELPTAGALIAELVKDCNAQLKRAQETAAGW